MPAFRDVFGIEPPVIEQMGAEPALICVVRDEALRLPHFLDHHRAIGIRRFFIIDDQSTDGTAAFIDAQPDAVRIPARGSYKTHQAIWVSAVADAFLVGRWALVLDADELLVYPGWPQRSLADLVASMDRQGEEALFCSLVDMYGTGPVSEIDYRAGQPFIDHCPCFDGEGYMLVPREILRRPQATPPYYIVGGTRQRLFFERRRASSVERGLARHFFPLDRRHPPGPVEKVFAHLALTWFRASWIKSLPAMSKVPLLRWRTDNRLGSGQHASWRKMKIADEWGSLLHFKYLQDFAARTLEGVQQGQHTRHYLFYKDRIERQKFDVLFHEGSRRFQGVSSLIEAGLVRERGTNAPAPALPSKASGSEIPLLTVEEAGS